MVLFYLFFFKQLNNAYLFPEVLSIIQSQKQENYIDQMGNTAYFIWFVWNWLYICVCVFLKLNPVCP